MAQERDIKKNNILILTQKVDKNDDILGFFHVWIAEFAKNFGKVTVICLQTGEYSLPENVKVLSLGKEKTEIINFKFEVIKKFFYIKNFFKYIWQERKNYDQVFVHMNHAYIIFGGIFWRLLNKKISLWYAHGHVSFSLKLAEIFSNIIFTSTQSGFRISSQKVRVVGQGIDTDFFSFSDKFKSNFFEIITVGRISPIKDYETLIEAVELLTKEYPNIRVKIIGGAILYSDQIYFEKLKKIVSDKKLEEVIIFTGAVPYVKLPPYFHQANLFVNMSHTGSLDKTLLEAMSCGVPILSCNESLKEILGDYQEKLMYHKRDVIDLVRKIRVIQMDETTDWRPLREIVVANHSLQGLIQKIYANIRN